MRADYVDERDQDELILRACVGSPCEPVRLAADWTIATTVAWNARRWRPAASSKSMTERYAGHVTLERFADDEDGTGAVVRVQRTTDADSIYWDGRLALAPEADLVARYGGFSIDADRLVLGVPAGANEGGGASGEGWIPCAPLPRPHARCLVPVMGGAAVLDATVVSREAGPDAEIEVAGTVVGPVRPLRARAGYNRTDAVVVWALAPAALREFRLEYDALARAARIVVRERVSVPSAPRLAVLGLLLGVGAVVSTLRTLEFARPVLASAAGAGTIAVGFACVGTDPVAGLFALSACLRLSGAWTLARFGRPVVAFRLARGTFLDAAFACVYRLVPDVPDSALSVCCHMLSLVDAVFLVRKESTKRRPAPLRTYTYFAVVALCDAAKLAVSGALSVYPAASWLSPSGRETFCVAYALLGGALGIMLSDETSFARDVVRALRTPPAPKAPRP